MSPSCLEQEDMHNNGNLQLSERFIKAWVVVMYRMGYLWASEGIEHYPCHHG